MLSDMQNDHLFAAVYIVAFLSVMSCEGITVRGYEGETAIINCPSGGYKNNPKYLWRDFNDGVKVIQSDSHSEWIHRGRFSLQDKKDRDIFTVTIHNLTLEDAGIYWCGVDIQAWIDIYTIVKIIVGTPCSHSHPINEDPAGFKETTFRVTVEDTVVDSSAVYQKLDPNTTQPDAAFKCLNPKSTQPDVLYQSLDVNTTQPDAVYQSLEPNTTQHDAVYQSLESNTTQHNTVYQSLNLNTTQPDAVYQSLNPNTTQPDAVYQSLNPNTIQPDPVYQGLNVND